MKKLNQAGMSSILFAMVFVIILSLLAVGFTTLVRNDQQQVLDKTLSFQAQYAAETAINRKASELIAASAAGSPISDSLNCNFLTLTNAGFNASAKVTCITWTSAADSIVKNNIGTDPYITRLNTGSSGISIIKVTWQSDSFTSVYTSVSPPNLPVISNSNIPILRLTLAHSDLSSLQHMYFVPALATVDTQGDGNVLFTECSGGLCTTTFSYDTDGSWLSIMAYGGLANVTIQASNLSGGIKPLIGAQATIDANAISQDVTKRIQARVSLVSQTWAPGFAMSAGTACKDFKVDGTQDTSASGARLPCL